MQHIKNTHYLEASKLHKTLILCQIVGLLTGFCVCLVSGMKTFENPSEKKISISIY